MKKSFLKFLFPLCEDRRRRSRIAGVKTTHPPNTLDGRVPASLSVRRSAQNAARPSVGPSAGLLMTTQLDNPL